jgi:hypothetical protein
MFSENSFMVVLLEQFCEVFSPTLLRRLGLHEISVRAGELQAGVLTVVLRSGGLDAGNGGGLADGKGCLLNTDLQQ